ncbi:MAG: DUF2075 domain-containing protein [Candidatus Baltobacteraceae bacterium]
MQLYAGSMADFTDDAVQHRIAEKLGDAYYEYFRFRASASEFASWQNSLTALTSQLQYSGLRDQGIALELQLPLASSRLDVLLAGYDEAGAERALILELKQWTTARASDDDECVLTYLGHREREVAHPSRQAANYRQYLADMNSAFHASGSPIALEACSWLHNLDAASEAALRDSRFEVCLRDARLFTGRDADRFRGFLQRRFAPRDGVPVLSKVVAGPYAPSKKLLAYTARTIEGETAYTLLDDQIVAFNTVLTLARRGLRTKADRSVVTIRGGPGTGKSVLAINLMGRLLKEGKNVQYATGSKAFTENLRRVIGARARPLFQYFNSYAAADPGSVDVLVCDEAHRIRKTSDSRFTPRAARSGVPQIDELIAAARVAVFFVDDHQGVRPDEIGSSTLIREAAVAQSANYREVDLTTQFRCAGSDQYVDWLDQLLEVRKTGQYDLPAEDAFDFQIANDPADLDRAIRRKAEEGESARMTAGFCWRWSDPKANGTLVDDVVVGDFRRPWNAKPAAGRLAQGIPKASFWATDPQGLDQVGCVYTAQGFEFDYVGVIFGRDLRYDPAIGAWVGDPTYSHDAMVKRNGPRFTDCVKNVYRVLLTRGMKGCYVYFQDEPTRAFVASRM